MENELFNQSDINAGLNIIIVSYFDRMYEDGDFIRAIELLSEKVALNKDGAYCCFGDLDSYYEEFHFNGVEFAMGYPPSEAEEIIVSEETCYAYVRLACERFLKIHPENKIQVNEILSRMPY
ncbi:MULTISPECIES: ribonuclease toxin immunity protein CdiI [unclassified Acinetobacter]|uniref:ribonuclease toxin immunity protein CdiI n=1 Tax=unclassified Acinetobacter TaxID=196816 RepID=UPI0025762303|nr:MULTISPECIES: ribonuclease toxin immunity protein CdiI [unclassified Acinetobacter]MDM1757247.1 ribonuclease toxin immunity protein CdiI [Acinetobacter sp. 256-1]MDM1760239.1 ribonuclease toxin immunity protein CdiI [Acinetobacter sp. 251-1]